MDEKRILLPVLVLGLLLLVAGAASGLSAATLRVERTPKGAFARSSRPAARQHVDPRLTRRARATAWRWQSIVGRRHARLRASLASPRALAFWRRQALRMTRVAEHPPHKAAWECIHRYEGSWRDSGDPYWGGLQMDRGFMSRYAPRLLLRRGWANRWSPLEQMWVAERAHRTGIGFSPWPNTARYCGLL